MQKVPKKNNINVDIQIHENKQSTCQESTS